MSDHLGDHGIVELRHFPALFDAGVDADAFVRGRPHQTLDSSWLRDESLRGILGVEARFYRVAVAMAVAMARKRRLARRFRQRLTRRDAELQLDEVEPGDHFRDGVLDLQTRVHLEEVQLARRRRDELDRARALVVDGSNDAERVLEEPRAPPGAFFALKKRGGRRRLLDDLLVAPLHAAFAFRKSDRRPEPIAKHLNLDVPRRFDVALDVDARIAERGAPAIGARRRGALELRHVAGDLHADTTAPARRLDEHGQADFRHGLGEQRRVRRIDRAVAARRRLHADGPRDGARLDLVAERVQGRDGRTDERRARRGDALGEFRVLAEQAIPGVDGARARLDERRARSRPCSDSCL